MTFMIGMRDFKHWQKASNQSITKLTKQHIAIAVMVIIIIIIAAD